MKRPASSNTRGAVSSAIVSAMSNTASRPTSPSTVDTSSTLTDSPAKAITWSSALCASRMLPSADRAMSASPASSMATLSAAVMTRSCSAMAAVAMVRNSNTCDRDKIVSGILSTRVVAMMKTTCDGGSSTDLSSALNELDES